jgi:hypothetical protein
MGVINLNSGKIEQDAPDIAANLPPQVEPPRTGGAIDLTTGQYLSEQELEPQEVVEPQETSFLDVFTGTERIEETPELGTLPEFGVTEEGDVPRIALGLLSTFEPKAQQEMILQAIPEAVFETTPDGSTIIEVPTKEGGTRRSVLNRPGFSPQDLTTATAQVLSFVGPARLANLGKTLLQKVGIGAAGAGATEQGLQEIGVALGREERDPVSTAIATGTGGLAEVAVPAIQAFRGARQAKAIGAGKEEIEQVAENVMIAQRAGEETGIPLFQAQQTGVPSQLERQSFVAQLPAGTQSAVKELAAQNKAAGDAVESFLNQIAPPESIVTGAEKFRTAAKASLEKANSLRAEKASPLYKQALDDGASVNLTPLREAIASKLDDLPESGEIAKSLRRVLTLTKGAKGSPASLRRLHNAKIEVDQMINKVGEGALGNTTKNELEDAQKLLLNQMDEASPAYKSARDVFAEASPPVVKAQESIVGKIADLDDAQLKQIHGKIFDPAQTNPQVTAQARKAISDIDPDAWDQLVRIELEKRLGSIKSIAEGGTVDNIPGQLFRAIFPNDKSTKVLLNSLGAEQKRNIKYLQIALKRASLGRPGGSQTAAREEIKRELRGGIFQSLRELFRSPISTITSAGEDAAFNSRAAALAKAMYDPTWKAEMKAIRKFSPKSPAAGRALTQLINDIEATERTEEN